MRAGGAAPSFEMRAVLYEAAGGTAGRWPAPLQPTQGNDGDHGDHEG